MVHRDERRPDRIYWRCLEHSKDGHAIYPTLDATIFKPGVCGYFDRDGDWQHIVDLSIGADKLRNSGYTALPDAQDLSPKDPSHGAEEIWGPRTSRDLRRIEGAVEGSAEHQGVGVQASVKFKSTSDEAAVLLTQGSISRWHTRVKDQIFVDWMTKNADKIIRDNQEAKDWGIWIVTKTCSAKRRAISVVESKDTELSWLISGEVQGAAKLAPSANWWSSHDTSEWTQSSMDAGIVLFMLGIEWRPSRIPWRSAVLKPILDRDRQQHLGAAPTIQAVEVVEGTESEGELTRFEVHIDSSVDEEHYPLEQPWGGELLETDQAWTDDNFSVEDPFEI